MTAAALAVLRRSAGLAARLGPVAPVALAAAGCFVAGLAALPAYQVASAPAVLAAAAGGAALVAVVAVGAFRVGPPVSYGASLAVLVLLLVAVSGFHPGDVLRALEHGPNRVLTETLPIGGGLATLAPLTVLVWLSAGACSEILLRSAGSRRGRAALAVPLLLYALSFAVASAAPTHDRWGAPVLLAVLAAAATLRQRQAAPAEESTGDTGAWLRFRPLAAGVAAAAAVAVALAAAAPAVPVLSARPAAVHRRPPLALPPVVDPVGVMARLRDGRPHQPPRPELTARLGQPSTGYLAMAEMDSYDGAHWQFTATFDPTGGRVPQPAAAVATVDDAPVVQSIDITATPPEPLLPALDRPVSVAGTPVVADAATGMLLPQSAAARRYTVVSEAPSVTLSGLPAADGIDPAAAPAAASTLPPNTSTALATALRFLAGLTGERPAPTVAFLQDELSVLHAKEKRIDPSLAAPSSRSAKGPPAQAPAGTSLSAVINAVTVDRAATPEEFATFFAMTARYLGVPVRMVTGYRLVAGSTGAALPAGTYSVTSRQAWAWAEVPVAGVGWVVADPTPDATTAAAAPPPESVQAPSTTLPPRQANAVPRNQVFGGHALAPKSSVRLPHRSHTPAWVLPLVVVLAGLILACVAGPGQAAARRAWRRRTRRSDDPNEMAVGAWLELLDGLDRAGMRPRAGATNTEVAADVADHFGPDLAEPAGVVATIADQAMFSVAQPVAAESARQAWETTRTIHTRVAARLDRRDRLRSLLVVGSAPRRPYPSDRSRRAGATGE